MPILTERDLLSSILPQGWKVIEARSGGRKACNTVILSPQGKRFETLEAVNDFLLEQDGIGKVEEEIQKVFASKTKITNLNLTEAAKMKRKYMAMKNPFRNLLKRTLEKNHAVTVCKKKKSYDYQMYLIKRKREHKKLSKGF